MKTYISDSLISESLILLHSMQQNNCYSIVQIPSIKTYYGINKQAALNLALQCQWLVLVDDELCELTTLGKRLMQMFNGMQISSDLYREILYNYIVVCKPIWARRIPFGRFEAYRVMSQDEQICFTKAGLMVDPVTRFEVDWWDSLASKERIIIDEKKDVIGRNGEELSIAFEKKRTGALPIWESVNTNLAGYDILSQASDTDPSQILIEVKSSSKPMHDASFFVTRNEWAFASEPYNMNRYFFHLWLLNDVPRVAVISRAEIENHIPSEKGQGEWSETIIPFEVFKDSFIVYK